MRIFDTAVTLPRGYDSGRRPATGRLRRAAGPPPGESRRVAASYLDVGRECVSSVYAIFEPEFSVRSLGIATMIWEMDEARRRGARYYHPGYAFHDCPSMDYKKQFRASEWFDWQSGWRSLERPQRR